MKAGNESVELASAVSESRIWSRLMELAEIGRAGCTGVNRPAFSPEDRQAKRLLVDWGRRLGAAIYQDGIGNLFLRYESRECSGPPLVTGSHLDSQPSGGRFDGAYGVIAALEVLEVFSDAKIPVRRPIEVVAWSNEEGGRFAPGAMGSQFFAGLLDIAAVKDVRDSSGVRLEDALAETIESLPEAKLRSRSERPYAYIEAHIEQGPILQDSRKEIGIVDGIQGCIWVEYTVRGRAAHAGTTPMQSRRDALRQATRMVQDLEALCLRNAPECRFTVGRISAAPGSPNAIPEEVRFTVDFRERSSKMFTDVRDDLLRYDHGGPCSVAPTVLFEHGPQQFDADIIVGIQKAAVDLGYAPIRLTSGAFHDALFVAETCRTAMIFVPCKDGISHHPDEYSSPIQLADGTKVLTATVYSLVNEQARRMNQP